jgi:hypothetical protein
MQAYASVVFNQEKERKKERKKEEKRSSAIVVLKEKAWKERLGRTSQ